MRKRGVSAPSAARAPTRPACGAKSASSSRRCARGIRAWRNRWPPPSATSTLTRSSTPRWRRRAPTCPPRSRPDARSLARLLRHVPRRPHQGRPAMEKDPREQQRTDAERIPDERPGRLDDDVERLEDVDVGDADDDFDVDDDIDDDPGDDELEEV